MTAKHYWALTLTLTLTLTLAVGLLFSLQPGTTAQAADTAGVSRQIQPDQAPDGLTTAEWNSIQNQIMAANAPTAAANPQLIRLTSENPKSSGDFGYSVAVDGNTAVIGAPYELHDLDNNISVSGVAYVFVYDGASWKLEGTLRPSDPAFYIPGFAFEFGYSVAVDGNTAVIGAPNARQGIRSGAAYVFVRSGTSWSEEQKLTPLEPPGKDGGEFGWSVAVDGNTAVIGAPGEDTDGKFHAGTAHVWVRSGTSWSEQQKLTATILISDDDAQEGAWFGHSVAVDGDTAVIGAWHYTTNAPIDKAGAAYVFLRSGTPLVWSPQQKLTSSNPISDGRFGSGVAVDGDKAVIGAHSEHPGGLDEAGAAYVWVRSGTSWSEEQKLTAADAANQDHFGNSVAMDGDKVVIGAPLATNTSTQDGAAYVFVYDGTDWSEQQKLTSSVPVVNGHFGNSVAVAGDTVVIGALFETAGGFNQAGAAYVFSCIRSQGTGGGDWSDPNTWEGGVVPGEGDWVCILKDDTVTLTADAKAGRLYVYGKLDLVTYPFTVEVSVRNEGVIQQKKTVGIDAVNFIQIRNSADLEDRYRGLDISANSNLGETIVQVRGNTSECTDPSPGDYRNRCFKVEPVDTADGVTVTLHTTAEEDDISNDAFYQYDASSSGPWTLKANCPQPPVDGGECPGTTDITGPAWFLIAAGGPTAISLQDFAAQAGGGGGLVGLVADVLATLGAWGRHICGVCVTGP